MCANSNTRLFFVHVPRTGGTSLEALLTASGFATSPAYWEGGLIQRDSEGYSLFTGHHFAFAEHLIKPTFRITILRDPVERLRSLWAFMKAEQPERAQEIGTFDNALDTLPQFSNHVTRFLGVHYPLTSQVAALRRGTLDPQQLKAELGNLRGAPVGHSEYSRALDRLMTFEHVGIFEQYITTLDSLAAKLGISHINVPRHRTSLMSKPALNHNNLKKIHERNHLDLALYQVALREHT